MYQKGMLVGGATMLALAGGVLFAPQALATAPPPQLWVSPATVSAGGTLDFSARCYGTASAVTSSGLTAPVKLSSSSQSYAGSGKAVATPGKYTASFTCSGNSIPSGNGTATVDFTVVCEPVATNPPPTSTTRPVPPTSPTSSTPVPSEPSSSDASEPPVSSAAVAPAAAKSCGAGDAGRPGHGSTRSPQVKVVPKGAAQTGDGSEATY